MCYVALTCLYFFTARYFFVTKKCVDSCIFSMCQNRQRALNADGRSCTEFDSFSSNLFWKYENTAHPKLIKHEEKERIPKSAMVVGVSCAQFPSTHNSQDSQFTSIVSLIHLLLWCFSLGMSQKCFPLKSKTFTILLTK